MTRRAGIGSCWWRRGEGMAKRAILSNQIVRGVKRPVIR